MNVRAAPDAQSASETFTYVYRRRRWLWLFQILDGLGGLFHRPKLGIPDLSGSRCILVLKLDQVGDLLLSRPLLGALRIAAPQARLECVVGKDRGVVAARFPELDGVHELPVRLPPHAFPRVGLLGTFGGISRLRRLRPDVTVAAKEEPLTVLLAWLVGSPVRIGFREGGLGFLLTHTVRVTPGVHQFRVLAALAGPAGERFGPPEYPVTPMHRAAAAAALQADPPPSHLPLVIVHPGAGVPSKRWPWSCFAETLERVSRMRPVAVLVVQGPQDPTPGSVGLEEGSWVRQLPESMELGSLAALLDQADLFLGNDSAPAHLAAAVGTPAVVVYMTADDPARWGPADPRSRVIVGDSSSITPKQVAACVLDCLNTEPRRIKAEPGPES